jgi:hypothetical protein
MGGATNGDAKHLIIKDDAHAPCGGHAGTPPCLRLFAPWRTPMAAAPHRVNASSALSYAMACACAVALAPTVVDAAGTRVYRCEQGARVTYSDQECANARVVDVDGGAAAPDAAERLRRDQQALDDRAAQLRELRARDEAIARMNVAQAAPPADEPAPTYYADNPGYGYGVWDPTKPRGQDRRRDRRDDRRDDRDRRRQDHIVVKPPPHVPRPPILR